MRSLLVSLILAAPVCAVAATPSYTNPMSTTHAAKPQTVCVTFVNHTSQEREVRVGDEQFTVRLNSQIHIAVPVGSPVRVYSNQNSKVNGQQILVASAKDNESAIFLQ